MGVLADEGTRATAAGRRPFTRPDGSRLPVAFTLTADGSNNRVTEEITGIEDTSFSYTLSGTLTAGTIKIKTPSSS